MFGTRETEVDFTILLTDIRFLHTAYPIVTPNSRVITNL